MPLYSYKNTETGEEWEEWRTISRRKDGVDGVKIIQTLKANPSKLTAANHAALQRHRAHDKFQRDTLAPICETWRGSYDSNM